MENNLILEEILESARPREIGNIIRLTRESKNWSRNKLLYNMNKIQMSIQNKKKVELNKDEENILKVDMVNMDYKKIVRYEKKTYTEITDIKNEKEKNVLILIAKTLGKSSLYYLFEKSKITDETSQDEIYSLTECILKDFFNNHDMQDIDNQKIKLMRFFLFSSVYESVLNDRVNWNVFILYNKLGKSDKNKVYDFFNIFKVNQDDEIDIFYNMYLNYNNEKMFFDKYEEIETELKKQAYDKVEYSKIVEYVIDNISKNIIMADRVEERINIIMNLNQEDLKILLYSNLLKNFLQDNID